MAGNTQDELGTYYDVKKQKESEMSNQKHQKTKTRKTVSGVCQRET